jgi:phosphoribosyl-dephospho-CoA transferase
MLESKHPFALQRHDLLLIDPAAWSEMLKSRHDLKGVPYLTAWAEKGWPVIVRRVLCSDKPGLVSAAVPLPPTEDKRRIALQFPRDGVTACMPPLALHRAIGKAPRAWKAALDSLMTAGINHHTEVRVFGSLLWQVLTGLDYLTASSDIDLLWCIEDRTRLWPLLECIGEIDTRSPMRIDGELLLPDGGGINWREMAGQPDEVLVKTLHGVETRTCKDILSFHGAAA